MSAVRRDTSEFHALPGFEALAVEGPDAGAFLQAQLASDVAALAPGDWQWSSWLGAQGRVLALLLLLRTAPEAYVVLLPHGRADDLAGKLRRFVLRARLAIARAALHPGGVLAPAGGGEAALATSGAARAAGDAWELDLGGSRGRSLRLAPVPASGDAGTDWARADIADGVPWIAPAVADTEIPQALGLDRLRAFSLGKGCYPGQEVVARTHYLGRSKRSLVRFRGPGPVVPAPGSLLSETWPGAVLGRVVAAVPDAAQVAGLAVLRGESDVAGEPGPVHPLAFEELR